MSTTPQELDVLAKTLWAEARGEGFDGMVAVACAIRNRVDISAAKKGKPMWWGVGWVGVCTKGATTSNGRVIHQFSCWNADDPNRDYLVGKKPIPKDQYDLAMKAARTVAVEDAPDVSLGATHYYATTMPRPPSWIVGATKTAKIGRHVFYKDVP